MYKEKIIELKRKLEETEEKLREYQKKEKFDRETIRRAKELITDYQDIVVLKNYINNFKGFIIWTLLNPLMKNIIYDKNYRKLN